MSLVDIWTSAPYHVLLDALKIPHISLRDKPWGDNPKFPPHRYFALGMELEDYLDKHGMAEQRRQLVSAIGSGKPRVARELGAKLTVDQVPEIFKQVLKTAADQATGKPASAPS